MKDINSKSSGSWAIKRPLARFPWAQGVFQSATGAPKTGTATALVWVGLSLFVLGTALPAQAAIRYVDSQATGSNNGTSWANAWTSISSATGAGVSAGDTVYISTGTYANFSPKSGTAGNPIIYQIGQEAGHNGTATFTGSGTWLSNPHHVVVSGDAGDGAMHFVLSGCSAILAASSSSAVSYRLSYINFGTMTNPSNYGRLVNCTAGADFEFDHNWVKCGSTQNGDDIVFMWETDQPPAAYDTGLRFHHNVLLAPSTTGGLGMDGLRIKGTGISIYNNFMSGYASTGSQEHQDGVQNWQYGSYLKIYNNIIQDFNNAGLNVSAYFGGYSHVRMYNNLIVFTSSTASSACEGGFVGLAASGFTMLDCIVANNLIAGGSQGWSMNNSGGYSVTWSGCFIANNISVQGPSVQADTAHGVISLANANNLSLATAQSYFNTYASTLNGTNNDFRLKAGAVNLIGKGTNLTAYGITTDMDGNARPASGPWDIGPFQYGSVNTNPVISVSPTSLNFGSLLTNTTKELAVSVRNAGSGTLTGTATAVVPFSVVSGGAYSLAAGQSQVVTIHYSPTVVGTHSQSVTITGGGDATCQVSGIGLSMLQRPASPQGLHVVVNP